MRFIYLSLMVVALTLTGLASSPKRENVIGTVIAYNRFSNLLYLTDVPAGQDFIVRIERQGKESERLILVSYTYWMSSREDNSRFPSNLMKSAARWRLSLVRNPACDEPLRQFLMSQDLDTGKVSEGPQMWELLPGANSEKLPFGKTLECYSMKAGDYKPYNK
jgi:hypothetical protein